MTGQVRVLAMRAKRPDHGIVINTCGSQLHRDIDAFRVGPVPTPFGPARIFENAWQFTKHYANQTQEQWTAWMKNGLTESSPHRYPMNRGAKPMYAWWANEHGQRPFQYIDARKWIYGPLFEYATRGANTIDLVRGLIEDGETVWLRDFDGYDHVKMGMSLTDVLNNPRRKMGHAFWIAALATRDPMLEQMHMVEDQRGLAGSLILTDAWHAGRRAARQDGKFTDNPYNCLSQPKQLNWWHDGFYNEYQWI